MRVSTEEFFPMLPRILADQSRFDVLMVTYNTVAGPDYLPVPPGLTITARTGDLCYVIDPRDDHEEQVRTMERQARRAQNGLVARDDQRKYDLVIVYAGVTAFSEAVDCACWRKFVHPETVVIVLTCDCNQDTKEGALEALQASGQIDAAVWTKRCGGQFDLNDIRKGIIEVWKGRSESLKARQ